MQISIKTGTIKLIIWSAALLIMFACNCSGPTYVPVATKPPPTPLPATSLPTDNDIASAELRTDDQGKVDFLDPLTGNSVTLQTQAENSGQPITGLQVWFVSDSKSVLVIAHDSKGIYATQVEEFEYARYTSSSNPHLAAPRPQVITISTVLLMAEFLSVYQNVAAWHDFYGQRPDIEKWADDTETVCINPDQKQSFSEAALGSVLILTGIGPAKLLPGGGEYVEAIGEVLNELTQEAANTEIASIIASQPPAIERWKIHRIAETVPIFAEPFGFCLDPLDRWDSSSALQWLVYSIEEKDLFTMSALASDADMYYANYLEGGQLISPSTFLRHFEERANSNTTCMGYEISAFGIRVWTSGWSPAWEMTESCYVSCQTYDPPWQSSEAAFFLHNYEGEWKLRTVYQNDPSEYYFSDNSPLIACDQPLDEVPISAIQASCPGAPPQRLVIGDKGYVCTQADRVIVRSGPSRSSGEVARLAPGTEFFILDGASCADEWSWWHIQMEDGETGWIAEGGDNVDPYFICPLEE